MAISETVTDKAKRVAEYNRVLDLLVIVESQDRTGIDFDTFAFFMRDLMLYINQLESQLKEDK